MQRDSFASLERGVGISEKADRRVAQVERVEEGGRGKKRAKIKKKMRRKLLIQKLYWRIYTP